MEMNGDRKEKDFWEKLVSAAKFLGGLGALIGSVMIPLILSTQAEKNRRAQIYAQIMSQREAKDTEIRARMFESLLSKYLRETPSNPDSKKDARLEIEILKEKITFLGLLMENFQEYFSARHLFRELYDKITNAMEKYRKPEDIESLKRLRMELLKIAKRTASRQINMLLRIGYTTGRIPVKLGWETNHAIPLYNFVNKNSAEYMNKLITTRYNVSCDPDFTVCPDQVESEKKPAKSIAYIPEEKKDILYSLIIKVKKIEYPEVEIEVQPEVHTKEKGRYKTVDKDPFSFSVSFFDMPFMDNSRLSEGTRFAIVLKNICTKETYADDDCSKEEEKSLPFAIFQVVVFKEEFMSLRDRPLFEEMIKKLSPDRY